MKRGIFISVCTTVLFLMIFSVCYSAEIKETKPINENETLAIIKQDYPPLYEQLKNMKTSNPERYWDTVLLLDKDVHASREIKRSNLRFFKQCQRINNLEPVSPQEEKDVLKFIQGKYPDVYSQMEKLKLQAPQAYERILAMYKKGIKNQALISANFPQKSMQADGLSKKLSAQSLEQAEVRKNFISGAISREEAKKKLYLSEYSLIKSLYDKNPVNASKLYYKMIDGLHQELVRFSMNQGIIPKEIITQKKQAIAKQTQILQKAAKGDLRDLVDFDVEQQLKAIELQKDSSLTKRKKF